MNRFHVALRYIGSDARRRYLIQRSDGKFWTGTGWSRILDCAKIWSDSHLAAETCVAIQRRRYAGKPERTFKVEMTVTLAADDIAEITQDQLAKYLANAVRIGVDNAVFGDGPTEGSFVRLKMELATLSEAAKGAAAVSPDTRRVKQ